MSDATAIRPYELTEKLGNHILPSQREFIFAPERYSFIAGGFRSGKSHAMCLKGVILSAAIPGNRGMLLCYRGTDTDARIKPLMDEILPTSWIRSYNKKDRTYVLRNNSQIILSHLHDASSSSTKSRRIGTNLGWFGIDQVEECQQEHWNTMISRLSLPLAPKKFGFATLNPAGRDWVWEKGFRGMQPWPRGDSNRTLALPDGKFYQAMRPESNVIGIAINSEENRVSNGGFVDDEYFDSLLDQYGQDWIERYVYCSFDDFKGKLFKDYEAGLADDNVASVHNIEPFDIPRHWSLVGGIDVGGDSPWAVIPIYVDEQGNLIVTPGFHNRTGRVSEVARWIKNETPYNENRTRWIIDPENSVATVELSDYGIYTQTAQKAINPGLLRLEGYFHVQERRELPTWFEETQPTHKFLKFRGKGSPQIFVFKTAQVWRKEHDLAKWDPTKPDVMFKSSTLRFDSVEATRYVVMARPEAAKPPSTEEEKYIEMEKKDPATAREWRMWEARMHDRITRQRGGGALREMDAEEQSPMPESPTGRYDYQAKDE